MYIFLWKRTLFATTARFLMQIAYFLIILFEYFKTPFAVQFGISDGLFCSLSPSDISLNEFIAQTARSIRKWILKTSHFYCVVHDELHHGPAFYYLNVNDLESVPS